MTEAVETTAVLAASNAPGNALERPSLLERHFRAKLQRMYARTAERQQRAPVALQRAAEKRARKAAKRAAH